MDLSLEHKKEVQKRIMEILLGKYEKMELSQSDFEEISRFIVDKDQAINNHHDLIVFLRELTAKWSIFSFVLTLENGEVKQFEESKKVAQQGGNVAKVALKELEAKTGKKVVTELNAKSILINSKTDTKLNSNK